MEKNNKIPTIKDIAKISGFSHATVSRVLNKKGKFYSEKTRIKIEQVAIKMRYTPNAIARQLKRKKTHTIAYMIPLSQSFYFSIYHGIREVAYKNGYNVLIMNADASKEIERKNIDTLLENRLEGVIIASSLINDKQIELIRKKSLPVVLVDREEEHKNISNVVINNEEISFLGTEYLIKRGYKKIAYISGPLDIKNYKKRFLGYKRALKKNSLEFDRSIILLNKGLDWLSDFEGDYEKIKDLLKKNREITAIFLISETLPIITVRIARELGLVVPDEIGILGFNELPVSKYMSPSISSIVSPTEDMGKQAMNILLRMINNNNQKEYLELKARLVKRESTSRK